MKCDGNSGTKTELKYEEILSLRSTNFDSDCKWSTIFSIIFYAHLNIVSSLRIYKKNINYFSYILIYYEIISLILILTGIWWHLLMLLLVKVWLTLDKEAKMLL
jgi:hypothetical protein